jgi:hypothetical protein
MEWNKRYLRSHGLRRPLLHAYETSFIHPFTGQQTILRAPLPEDILKFVNKISSQNMQQSGLDIVDAKSGLLTVDTVVAGKFGSSHSKFVGGTPIIASQGYVPYDRIRVEEEDWTKIELSEDPEFFR